MEYYSYTYGMNDTMAGVLAVLGGLLIVALLIALVAYILFALGLSRMAKLRGLDNTFLAWIPVANAYLLGKVADDVNRYLGKQTNYRTILLVLSIISFAGGFIPVVGALASFGCGIAMIVVQAIALYAIYKDYSPDNAVIMLVTSIIFSISFIFLFAIRNKRPITLGGGQYPGGPGGPGGYNGYNGGYNNGYGAPNGGYGYQGGPAQQPGAYPPPPAGQSYVPRQPQQPTPPQNPTQEGENPHE